MDEYWTKPDHPLYQHLTNYARFAEYLKFYALPDTDVDNTIFSQELHLHNAVTENTEIIARNDNWAHLQYLQAYYIKAMSPEIKIKVKAWK